jgi:D-arginine dehydrogenase
VHLRSEVRGLRRDGDQWVASTASGNFRAPVVINAAGAWGDDIAARAGVTPVGLQPMRRTALLIELPNEMSSHSWPVAIDIAEQFYFKPDAGLLLLSPADEIPSPACDAQPEDLEVAIAIDRFERATGAEVRQVKHRWAGLRVFAPDRSPVVGFDPIAKGFFWLVGQGGYGIQTAPAMGRVAAALAAGDPIPVDLLEAGVTTERLAKSRFGMSRAA